MGDIYTKVCIGPYYKYVLFHLIKCACADFHFSMVSNFSMNLKYISYSITFNKNESQNLKESILKGVVIISAFSTTSALTDYWD